MECEEFKDTRLDYERIYDGMNKPAFIFDGRLIFNEKRLMVMGFKVETIGRPGENLRKLEFE